MNTLRSTFLLAIALLLGTPAMAGDPHDDSAPITQAGAWSDSSSQSAAVAGAVSLSGSTSNSTSGSVATGGTASSNSQGGNGGTSSASGVGVAGNVSPVQETSVALNGGEHHSTSSVKLGDMTSGDSTSSAQSGDAKAEANGGAQTTVVAVQGDNYEQVRQAPSVAQGSIVIQTCSAGGNAGGSNTSGSAFLGFAYITGSCYDLSYAAAYAALGQRQAACDILRTSKRGKKYKARGVTLPAVCLEPSMPVPADTVTRAELNQKLDRMLKAAVSK